MVNTFQNGDDAYEQLFFGLDHKIGLDTGGAAWTFMCFANQTYNTAQCTLILLDAAVRVLDQSGSSAGAFSYHEAEGMGWFRSRRPFTDRFDLSVRIKAAEYPLSELEHWFLIEAHDAWHDILSPTRK